MSIRRKLVYGPAKSIIRRGLSAFGYAIAPKSNVGTEGWMGLPNKSFKTVLDIGANTGGFASEILLPRFPDAIIHSFEPSPVPFQQLFKISKASAGKIIAHPFGLGAESGQITFNDAIGASHSSSILKSTDIAAQLFPHTSKTTQSIVEIRRLDDIAPALGIVDDLLVKIDVQGFEDRVIQGGLNTIGRAQACIIEVQSVELYSGQPSFRDIFLLLDSLGFYFDGVLEQFFAADGTTIYFDAVFLKST